MRDPPSHQDAHARPGETRCPHCDEVQLITVTEMAGRLSIGRSQAYELCRRTDFYPAVRLGHSVRVSLPHLARWIDEHPARS